MEEVGLGHSCFKEQNKELDKYKLDLRMDRWAEHV